MSAGGQERAWPDSLIAGADRAPDELHLEPLGLVGVLRAPRPCPWSPRGRMCEPKPRRVRCLGAFLPVTIRVRPAAQGETVVGPISRADRQSSPASRPPSSARGGASR
jgi:hypothetical protein